MRTDAMQFFSGGNEVTPKRMGCIEKRTNSGNNAGFAKNEPCCSGKKPFRKVLAEVASENVAAERITAATMKKRTAGSNGPGGICQAGNVVSSGDSVYKIVMADDISGLMDTEGNTISAECNDQTDLEMRLVDGTILSIDKGVAADAERIVKEALADISEVLGITIFQGMENLSLSEIDGDTQEQFAEIVFILKKLIQGFELGRTTGMTIETPKTTIDGNSIDGVADVLRMSVFKIEVACSTLGIGESVQRQVAVKLEINDQGGILQATDPATLMMASQHRERLFGDLLSDSASTGRLASLIETVKRLIDENGGIKPVVTVDGIGNDSASKLESAQLDTQVYRILLKIDRMDKVDRQNGEAALNDGKTDQPKTALSAVQLAKNLSAEADGAQQENTVLPDMKPGLSPSNGASVDARITASLLRMTDETIMEQITGKVQSVLRSGLSEVRVQLRPESLGEVALRIRIEGDLVQAKIEVQNQQVKEIMERNLPLLKDALAQQNLATGSFDIQVNSGLGRHSGGMPQGMWRGEETVQGNPQQEGKEDENGSSGQQQTGNETGRRFGSNSVEYFA